MAAWNPSPGRGSSLAFIVIGGLLGVLCLYLATTAGAYKDEVTTQGSVVGSVKSDQANNTTKYAATVEYHDANGNSYEATSTKVDIHKPVVGSKINVSYRPSHPSDGRVLDGRPPYVFIGMALFCGFFVVIGVKSLVQSFRRT